jgi:hypothetical protein
MDIAVLPYGFSLLEPQDHMLNLTLFLAEFEELTQQRTLKRKLTNLSWSAFFLLLFNFRDLGVGCQIVSRRTGHRRMHGSRKNWSEILLN